jgi:hypothetical protein
VTPPSSARGRYAHERTQNERLLRALRENPQGINPIDWLNEPAPDGGHRVTRCASRINDLRRAYDIVTIRRRGATLYRFVGDLPHDPDPQPDVPALDPGLPGLFERTVGSSPLSPYDPRSES